MNLFIMFILFARFLFIISFSSNFKFFLQDCWRNLLYINGHHTLYWYIYLFVHVQTTLSRLTFIIILLLLINIIFLFFSPIIWNIPVVLLLLILICIISFFFFLFFSNFISLRGVSKQQFEQKYSQVLVILFIYTLTDSEIQCNVFDQTWKLVLRTFKKYVFLWQKVLHTLLSIIALTNTQSNGDFRYESFYFRSKNCMSIKPNLACAG